MPRPAYPTPAEVAAAFAQSGLVECLPEDIGDALDEAKGDWEKDADWGPFLFCGEATERFFDAPGPVRPMHGRGLVGGGTRLQLRAGLLSLEELSVDGNVLQLGRDFFLDPPGGYDESGPATAVRFVRPITSAQQGVRILGDWGYCRQLEDSVWKAVLLRAAWIERDTISRKWQALTVEQQKSVLKAKESGPVRLEYAPVSGEKLLSLEATFLVWESAWGRALKGRVFTQP